MIKKWLKNRYFMQIVYLVILVLFLVYLSMLLEIKKSREIAQEQGPGEDIQEQEIPANVINETSYKEVSRECQESWFCAAWSDCRYNIQRRACLDLNKCSTSKNKPITEQSC